MSTRNIRSNGPIDTREAEPEGVVVRDRRLIAPTPVPASERLTDEETQEYRELNEQAKGLNTIFAYFTGRLARKYRLDLQRDSLTEQGEIIRYAAPLAATEEGNDL